MIAHAVAKAPEGEFDTGTTSAEWVARRIRKLRLKNRQVGGCRDPAGLKTAAD